eukprot:610155-Amorphochlora_amoeboformis.AAC.1
MAGDKKLKKVKKTKKSVSSKDKSKKKRKSADSKLKSSEKSTKRQKVIPKTKADSVATPRRSPRIAGQAGGLVGDLTLGKVAPHAAESKAQIKNPNDEHGNPPVAKFRVSERSQKLLANRGITHLFPIQVSGRFQAQSNTRSPSYLIPILISAISHTPHSYKSTAKIPENAPRLRLST